MNCFPTGARVGALRVAGVFLLALLLPLPASAQGFVLPEPAISYPDPDPAGGVYPEMDPTEPGLEATLNSAIRRSRDNPVPLAQRGMMFFLQGVRTRGQRDFDRAFAIGEPGSPQLRYAHWSYGWAMLSIGEHATAVSHWQRAGDLHPGNPEWLPATLAVGLWSMGERETALAFFDVAAREQPGRWGSAEAVNATTAGWRPNERLAAQSLHDHWRSLR